MPDPHRRTEARRPASAALIAATVASLILMVWAMLPTLASADNIVTTIQICDFQQGNPDTWTLVTVAANANTGGPGDIVPPFHYDPPGSASDHAVHPGQNWSGSMVCPPASSSTTSTTTAGSTTTTAGFQPITICHATASDTNPYEEITIDNQGELNGHQQHDGDLIPAPAGGCPEPTTTSASTTTSSTSSTTAACPSGTTTTATETSTVTETSTTTVTDTATAPASTETVTVTVGAAAVAGVASGPRPVLVASAGDQIQSHDPCGAHETTTITETTTTAITETITTTPTETLTTTLTTTPSDTTSTTTTSDITTPGTTTSQTTSETTTPSTTSSSTTSSSTTTDEPTTSATTTSATVSPTTVEPTSTSPDEVSPTTVQVGGTAFTGAENTVPLAVITLLLMSAGTGLLWLGGRRRRSEEQGQA